MLQNRNWPRLKEQLLHWYRKEQGSFTLESTIVFPILLALILLFIIFGMYMYQKVVLYYAASVTAERAAFGWDNSHRDARSGMLAEQEYDGLYWRAADDAMLGSLFGLGGDRAEAAVDLPLHDGGAGASLPVLKMEQSARWLEQAGLAYEGQLRYSNKVINRMVEVKLKQPLSAEQLEQSWLKSEPKSISAASIVDPVEFIRSVDLVRYYYSRFTSGSGGSSDSKAKAAQILAPYSSGNKAQQQ